MISGYCRKIKVITNLSSMDHSFFSYVERTLETHPKFRIFARFNNINDGLTSANLKIVNIEEY